MIDPLTIVEIIFLLLFIFIAYQVITTATMMVEVKILGFYVNINIGTFYFGFFISNVN